MAAIKTQAELEALFNDPAKFEDYQRGVIKDMLGETVKSQLQDVLSKIPRKRIPLFDPEQANPIALGASGDGQWDRFGTFAKALKEVNFGQVDSRLTKALGEFDGASGGFLVPEEFRAELLALSLEDAVVRPRARVIPMQRETALFPIIKDSSHATNLFGGVRAYWNPEAGDVGADSSQPGFGQARWTAHKLTGYTIISSELLNDTAIAAEALLTSLFAQALAYFEDDAFMVGTGAGQPEGILTAKALVSVAKETGQAANTIVTENLDKMYARMLPSSLGRAVWIANNNVFPQLAALSRAVGTGGSSVFMSNVSGAAPTSIYGRPVIYTEKAKTLGTLGDIYFADLSYYLIGDRQALEMSASPHVRFTTDETVFRFIQRVDGKCWLESALTPRNGTATLSPLVALATRA